MSNYSEIIDMFADLQKNIHREIGTLMGQMLALKPEKQSTVQPFVINTAAIGELEKRIDGLAASAEIHNSTISGMEQRIMEAIEHRFAALQTPIRRQSISSNEEAPVPPPAPTKGQTTLNAFVQDAAVRKLDLTGIAHTPIKNEIVVVNKVEEAEEAEEAEEEAEEAEEEGEEGEEEAEEAEEEAEEGEEAEEAEEEEGEEELTEFMYKGTKYFMDSECNVYGLTADGELNDEPVGTYNITTRRITFVPA